MLEVALTRRWPDAVEAQIAQDFSLTANSTDTALSPAQLRALMTRADVLGVTVTDQLDAQVFNVPGRRVKLLANFGVGYNHIDIEAAAAAGIAVTNTPGVLTDCTADLAMTLLLMCARRAGEGERELRSGRWHGWRPTHLLGTRVTGKTLGIVGAGRIGLATATRAHFGFGMNVLLNARRELPADDLKRLSARQVGLETLLEAADFVSLHTPSSPQTRHLLDASRLALMKSSAILINTARGEIVDETALIQALRERRIAGAGLDVYEHEPAVPEALLACDNLVALPHMGSGTSETRVAMGMKALANIRAYARGEVLPDLLT